MSLEDADPARGARVEIAVAAARKGDIATAAGIIAGMGRAERDEFGPLITAMLPGQPFAAASRTAA